MSEDEIMNEYEILKDQLFNERETYNFIDKLGYDDWNKKEVIREYIKHIREENQQLKETNEVLMKCLKIDKDKIDFNVAYAEHLEKVLDEIREYSLDLHLYDNESLEFKISNDLLQKIDKVKQ